MGERINLRAGALIREYIQQQCFTKWFKKADYPKFFQLAYMDAMSYDPYTKKGGAKGSIWFRKQRNFKLNKSLIEPMEQLRLLKDVNENAPFQLDGLSFADYIQLAGAVAVQSCGDPKPLLIIEHVKIGRKDLDNESEIPEEEQMTHLSIQDEKTYTSRLEAMGFSPKQMVALAQIEAFGKIDPKFSYDWYHMPWFSNEYYIQLLTDQKPGLLTDNWLLSDDERMEHVKKFAEDRELFGEEFIKTYVKMSELGHKAVTLSRLGEIYRKDNIFLLEREYENSDGPFTDPLDSYKHWDRLKL